MINPKFKYYLRKPNGSDYDYKYRNGAVVATVTSSTPVKELGYAPEGWEDQYLMWDRGFTYHGVLRSHSLGLKFTEDGALILRNEFYSGGIKTTLELYVEIFDEATFTYGGYYSGSVNFNGCGDETTFFRIEVVEGKFLQKLEAKAASSFEIPVSDNPGKLWVKLHTMYLQLLQKWIGSTTEVVLKDLVGNGFPTYTPLPAEGTNIYYAILTQTSISPQTLIRNDDASTQDFDFTLHYDFNVYIPSVAGAVNGIFEVGYFLFNSPATFVSETILYHSGSTLVVGASANYVGDVSTTISLNPGQWISCFVRMYPAAAAAGLGIGVQQAQITQNGSYITISDDQATPEGFFPALRWQTVTRELLTGINDDVAVSLSSTILGTTHLNKVLSCGDAIRNLDKSVLKTNFQNDFQSITSLFGAAFYWDANTQTAYIEPKLAVYYPTEIVNLGGVADVACEPFTAEMFSRFKNGQDTFTYDSVNGKDEFNVEVERTTPLDTVVSEKNMKSEYREDMNGILRVFLNLSDKKITDADTDNDVFVIHIEDSVAGTIPAGYPGAGSDYYNIKVDPSWSVTNVYRGDVAFNVELSPARAVYNNGDYLHSLLYGLDAEYIKFQTAGKSNNTGTKMISTSGGTTYDEGADIAISSLPDPIFKPFVFDVRTKIPVNLYSIMQSNPYGYVTFTWLGNTYKGFILKISQAPNDEAPQNIKLLCTTDTDLTNLIR